MHPRISRRELERSSPLTDCGDVVCARYHRSVNKYLPTRKNEALCTERAAAFYANAPDKTEITFRGYACKVLSKGIYYTFDVSIEKRKFLFIEVQHTLVCSLKRGTK